MNPSRRLWFLTLILAAALVTWGTGAALAQPVAANSSAVLTVSGLNDISMFQVPNGTGTPFTACFERGGAIVSAVITVTLRNAAGGPVIGYPPARIRIEHVASPLVWCADTYYPPPPHAPNKADAPTDAAGQTTFTLAYHGGHWVIGPTYVWVWDPVSLWSRIPTSVNVSYNSADMDGNLVVDLLDVVDFASVFFGVYHYRADFNYDQVVNLLDLAYFVPAYGMTCP